MSPSLSFNESEALRYQPNFRSVKDFIRRAEGALTVDVRSPSEFLQGHLPGAKNVPLFDDEERAAIGTRYHQIGKQPAIELGLEIAVPKLEALLGRIRQLNQDLLGAQNPIQVYCWRGGMRSRAFAWLLDQSGYQVNVLSSGYKSVRNHVLEYLERDFPLVVLSGLTGAGKTKWLQRLKERGEQVVDLEHLANHRGSAFGGIGRKTQPTVELFENQLFAELNSLDHSRRIWIEDESRKIGQVVLPKRLFEQIKTSPAIFLDVDANQRQQLLMDEYGALPIQEIADAIERIQKRLGGQHAKSALEAIESGDIKSCVETVLDYYDRTYLKAKSRIDREIFHHLKLADSDKFDVDQLLIETADQLGLN